MLETKTFLKNEQMADVGKNITLITFISKSSEKRSNRFHFNYAFVNVNDRKFECKMIRNKLRSKQ